MSNPGKHRWSETKARLRAFDRADLLALVGELYGASGENRRFLHARLLGSGSEIERYRRLITDAVYPDPFRKRPIRVGEAKRLIREYSRATDDATGTIDLRLTFIEAGTEQAADLGYGEDSYFASLASTLDDVEKRIGDLPPLVQQEVSERLTRIAKRAAVIGWGYGDYTSDVAARLFKRLNRRTQLRKPSGLA